MESNDIIEQLSSDDEVLASLAMKDLLARPDVGDIIAAYMDAPEPNLRRRIHQLSTINERRLRINVDFKEALLDNRSSFWELAVAINCIIDRQTSPMQINTVMERYVAQPMEVVKSITAFAKLMSDTGLHTENVPMHCLTDFLVNDVMLNNYGDECGVALVAQRLGAIYGWPLVIGFYRNALALRDRMFNVLLPSEWGVTHALTKEFLPLDKHSFAIYYLGQMRNAATVDQLPILMTKLSYLIHTAIVLKK
ncbi:MAG: hypothetical protein J5746_00315 [Victivallales bacterium]|nr:hypothetical protein [Victivallales bacterium]